MRWLFVLAGCGGVVEASDAAMMDAGTDASPYACTREMKCSRDQYCDYPDDRCGAMSAGVCKPLPTQCPRNYAPVCACGSILGSNDCHAAAMGLDLSIEGSCVPLGGYVRCGARFCDAEDSYCEVRAGTYSCKPLPAACVMKKDCNCFSGLCSTCLYADGYTLTCP